LSARMEQRIHTFAKNVVASIDRIVLPKAFLQTKKKLLIVSTIDKRANASSVEEAVFALTTEKGVNAWTAEAVAYAPMEE
jgi:hypothetical protein